MSLVLTFERVLDNVVVRLFDFLDAEDLMGSRGAPFSTSSTLSSVSGFGTSSGSPRSFCSATVEVVDVDEKDELLVFFSFIT